MSKKIKKPSKIGLLQTTTTFKTVVFRGRTWKKK